MTATALLVVVAVSVVMQQAGLPASLGAFLAGALLAESSYRHQLEADLKPFEGLLLGLFFTAIGMSLNLGLLVEQPLRIAGLVAGLLIASRRRGSMRLGLWQGLGRWGSRRLAIAISQGGEFAFVLFAVGAAAGVLARDLTELLSVVVTLSMAATPLLLLADDWVGKPRDAGARRLRAHARERRPRDHRRLRPLRPDHRPHPARQAPAVHRPRHQRRAGRLRARSSAPRCSMATPAGPTSWRRPAPTGASLRARDRRCRGLAARPRAWCASTIRNCRSTPAPATATTPTGCWISASRSSTAKPSLRRSKWPATCCAASVSPSARSAAP